MVWLEDDPFLLGFGNFSGKTVKFQDLSLQFFWWWITASRHYHSQQQTKIMNLNPTVSPDLLCSEPDSPIVAKHQKIIHSTGYYLLILTNLKKMLLNLDHFPKDRVENKKSFETTMYLEDHPSGRKRIITMVIISLLKIGLFFTLPSGLCTAFFSWGWSDHHLHPLTCSSSKDRITCRT